MPSLSHRQAKEANIPNISLGLWDLPSHIGGQAVSIEITNFSSPPLLLNLLLLFLLSSKNSMLSSFQIFPSYLLPLSP